MEGLYAEISSMKLGLRTRARAVAASYWKELAAAAQPSSNGGGG